MLVRHHLKYLELDGYDETVIMTATEHKILHNKLNLKINKNVLNNAVSRNRNLTKKGKDYKRKWSKTNIKQKWFRYYINNYILYTQLRYNHKTNNLTFASGIVLNHKR